MSLCKVCPACGASLDHGEVCECRGHGKPSESGQRVDARAAAEKERQEHREQALELSRAGRISYRLVDRPDFGPTLIEADVDGVPAFRYQAEYKPDKGIWRLRAHRVLDYRYRCLHLKRWVYIDDVKDARPDRVRK